jgi:hypothetical protein
MLRTALAIAVLSCFFAAPARAQSGPVIVVPGHPGVPVIINGYDASYGVVEGDWGLYRPGQVAPTVIYGPVAIPGPAGAGYYPYTGRRPRSGRYEVWPPANRTLPPPAPSFHRYWSSESDPVTPVTEYPPFNPPAVIPAPEFGARKNHKSRAPRHHKHRK